ncbi:MAG: transcriptional regulator, partial [Polaromonas sp.]
VGIVASIAYEAERDTALRALDAGALFGINLTKLAVRRGSYLRSYVYAFIESFAPALNRAIVEKTLSDGRAASITTFRAGLRQPPWPVRHTP